MKDKISCDIKLALDIAMSINSVSAKLKTKEIYQNHTLLSIKGYMQIEDQ